MKNKTPRVFILKAYLDACKGGVSSCCHKPNSSSCVNYCKQFLTYPVMENGIRIIPMGRKCLNIIGRTCCADAKIVNPQIPIVSKECKKASLWKRLNAGIFEESNYYHRKFLYPVFIPKDWDQLDEVLRRYKRVVNPDRQTEKPRQVELLIEALAKYQASRNWDKKGKKRDNI